MSAHVHTFNTTLYRFDEATGVESEPEVEVEVYYRAERLAPFAAHHDSPTWSDPGSPEEFEIQSVTDVLTGEDIEPTAEDKERIERAWFDKMAER